MPDINLKTFRKQLYHCLGNAKDAVFELTDAAILSRHPSSLAELSLSPVFRRQWHSTYLCSGRLSSITIQIDGSLHQANNIESKTIISRRS